MINLEGGTYPQQLEQREIPIFQDGQVFMGMARGNRICFIVCDTTANYHIRMENGTIIESIRLPDSMDSAFDYHRSYLQEWKNKEENGGEPIV